MKVYLAGKITGDKNYRAKFEAAEKMLEEEGHIVINPAVLPEGLTKADYMRICMAMIDSADVAVFLPDFRDSYGARIEFYYCEYIEKEIRYLKDGDY